MNADMKNTRLLLSMLAIAGYLSAQAPALPRLPKLVSSEELAKQPQTPGTTDDQERHYYFAEGAKEMPFRLYVPLKWNRQTKLPMIVALHGAFSTHDTMLNAAQGIVKTLAEKHGYIVVSPLGYGPLGGYGQHYDIGMRPPREGSSEEEQERASRLSELEVMKVVDLVAREYGVDESRIYLMGHSMGGLGTWYLGEKYRDRWAGLAPIAGGFENTDYPWERLRGMPVLVSNGSADTVAIPSRARNQVAAMEKAGLHPVYLEVPGATHVSILDSVFPQIFDYFDHNKRK
jgi:predicted peptidase